MKLPLEGIKHEIFSLREEPTDDNYGCYPDKRTLKQRLDFGFVLLDKPPGTRSKTAAAIAKQLIAPLGVTKMGYSGTLDPSVTGLLPLTINSANKVISTLLFGGKEYIALMHLHKEISEDKLRQAFEDFKGKIMQLPPVRSSVKRQYREREIYYSEIIDIEDKNVLFKIGVQSGTYIRKFISDLGEKMGIGANMAELRRTKVSTLTEKDHLVTLQDLDDAMYYYKNENDERLLSYAVQNVENAIVFLPKIYVSDSAVDTVCHGSPLAVPGVIRFNRFEINDTVFLSTLKGELIGLGKATLSSREILGGKKGIAIKTDSVVMKTGTYPKYEKRAI